MTKPLLHPTRITLGTAQLGLGYGIANRAGRPGDATATALLDRAWGLGIRSFDTARAYGDAEQRLGDWLGGSHHEAMVVSKLPKLAGKPVGGIFDESETSLGKNRLTIYMAHDVDDLVNPRVAEVMRALKEAGRIAAVLSRREIDSVVVGAETPDQIEEIAASAAKIVEPDLIEQAFELGASAPAEVFDPSTWPER